MYPCGTTSKEGEPGSFERSAQCYIDEERKNQDEKWGEQNHDPFTYLAILMEEVGELSQAALQTRFGGDKGGNEKIFLEAVQVAAAGKAIVECLMRRKWKWARDGRKRVRYQLTLNSGKVVNSSDGITFISSTGEKYIHDTINACLLDESGNKVEYDRSGTRSFSSEYPKR